MLSLKMSPSHSLDSPLSGQMIKRALLPPLPSSQIPPEVGPGERDPSNCASLRRLEGGWHCGGLGPSKVWGRRWPGRTSGVGWGGVGQGVGWAPKKEAPLEMETGPELSPFLLVNIIPWGDVVLCGSFTVFFFFFFSFEEI